MRDVQDCSCVLPCNVACYIATDTTGSSHVAINRSSFWSGVVLGTCPLQQFQIKPRAQKRSPGL